MAEVKSAGADLLSVPEVAELIPHANQSTLAHWRQIGSGPRWAKLGRRVYYRRSDVLAWIDAQFTASA